MLKNDFKISDGIFLFWGELSIAWFFWFIKTFDKQICTKQVRICDLDEAC